MGSEYKVDGEVEGTRDITGARTEVVLDVE